MLIPSAAAAATSRLISSPAPAFGCPPSVFALPRRSVRFPAGGSLSIAFSLQRSLRPVACVLKVFANADIVEDKNSLERVSVKIQMSDAGSGGEVAESLRPSTTFLDARTQEELLLGVRKELECGKLSANVAALMEELYQNYRNAIYQSGHPNAPEIVLSNMAAVFDRILADVEDPFTFSPYHVAIREPFDYYTFGQNYIRPLIDFRNSYIGNLSLFADMEDKVKQGHNVVLISNHQTEADPAIISLLLEKTNPYISEKMTFVAGDRVITDPLSKPFSMGRNLICVYSKKHMNDIPELADMKKRANTRSLKEMALLLRSGSQLIWIAPSGGRDRQDSQTGEWFPVEKEIGERRLMGFHGVGLSLTPEMDFEEFASKYEDPDETRMAFAKALYDSITNQYNLLKSAIYEGKGDASSSSVVLSQPW
ncbi:Glycerol-3-phosphate acyltransferase [Nymphaea thermarum]|nr:Glycerol-3-phosphate acyltransferase [Nymphaea thermarum]